MTQQTPPPVSGLAGVLSIMQAVVGLVPRWLVVTAGLVFVAWLGFELYQKAQQLYLQTVAAQSDTYLKCIKQGGCAAPPGQRWGQFGLEPIPSAPSNENSIDTAALLIEAKQRAMQSATMRAPDGRNVYSVGVIQDENTVKTAKAASDLLLSKAPLGSANGNALFKNHPDWWLVVGPEQSSNVKVMP